MDADSPGWSTVADVVGQGSDNLTVTLSFEREMSVEVITFLVVLIAMALAVSALAIALAINLGHQPMDSSILGWGAGLFFARLTLRFYLPGDPPVGSAIDVFALLWVIVFAFLAVTGLVWSWLARGRSPSSSPSDRTGKGSGPEGDGKGQRRDADAEL